MGYSDDSGLRKLVAHRFRLGVPEVRGILGWEPLLDRCVALLVPYLGKRVPGGRD